MVETVETTQKYTPALDSADDSLVQRLDLGCHVGGQKFDLNVAVLLEAVCSAVVHDE